MTFDEYQHLAERTMRMDMGNTAMTFHALHGMASEVGELHGLYQKLYQGHTLDMDHAQKEAGDCLWFLAEWCTANNIRLDSVAAMNIEKLKARYPDGFAEDKSLHRKAGDV